MTATLAHVSWAGHTIKPSGENPGGFVVVKGIVNVMPGATWFHTIDDAKKGIAALELAKAIAPSPDKIGHLFWMLMELTQLSTSK
jgi:hypothetical protein